MSPSQVIAGVLHGVHSTKRILLYVSAASFSVIASPNEFPATWAGAKSFTVMNAARSATSSSMLPCGRSSTQRW